MLEDLNDPCFIGDIGVVVTDKMEDNWEEGAWNYDIVIKGELDVHSFMEYQLDWADNGLTRAIKHAKKIK